MLVCIPTNGNNGREDTLCGHFGSAPFFTMYDTDKDEFNAVNNGVGAHEHGACNPVAALMGHKVDCVVCRGMGRRAIEVLNHSGIRVFLAATDNMSEVLESIKAGTLKEADPASACQGHGHGAGGCSHLGGGGVQGL